MVFNVGSKILLPTPFMVPFKQKRINGIVIVLSGSYTFTGSL